METTVKQRLIEFLNYKRIGQVKFANIVGVSRGYVNNIVNSIQPKTLHKITMQFPELNSAWLLTGEGEMLKGESKKNETNDDVVIMSREVFDQITRLTETVFSQQRTIEMYAGREQKQKQPEIQPYFRRCAG